MTTTAEQIRDFVVENFLFGEDSGFDADASFLEEGIIDSTGVLELVEHIEQVFAITVADDELVPEHFDSINRLAAYIDAKRGQ